MTSSRQYRKQGMRKNKQQQPQTPAEDFDDYDDEESRAEHVHVSTPSR